MLSSFVKIKSLLLDLDALKGKKVAVQKGTIEEGLAKKQLKDSTVISLTQWVRRLTR